MVELARVLITFSSPPLPTFRISLLSQADKSLHPVNCESDDVLPFITYESSDANPILMFQMRQDISLIGSPMCVSFLAPDTSRASMHTASLAKKLSVFFIHEALSFVSRFGICPRSPILSPPRVHYKTAPNSWKSLRNSSSSFSELILLLYGTLHHPQPLWNSYKVIVHRQFLRVTLLTLQRGRHQITSRILRCLL